MRMTIALWELGVCESVDEEEHTTAQVEDIPVQCLCDQKVTDKS